MLYKIQPTGPARRLATQQVGYEQKGKSAVQWRKLQQYSQYRLLVIILFLISDSDSCQVVGRTPP